jgi:LmbE family N-acetylglucosaminyl deacetylase
MSPSIKSLARGALLRAVHRIAPTEAETALRFLGARNLAAFPKRNVSVAASVPRGRVLILAPHPDDEAIGMGGTLCLHARNGSAVTVLYLTDGGGLEAERERTIAARRAEARALGEALSLEQVFWDNPDTKLTNDARTVGRLAELLAELAPEYVYAPSIFDHHYDHFATNQILVEALEQRPELRPPVAGYEVWDNVPFANYVVDISSAIEDKERAIGHYATPLAYTDFRQLCRSRNSVHYTLHVDSRIERAGRGFAEAFLRYDAELYCDLFRAYAGALRHDRSPLIAHLHRGAQA